MRTVGDDAILALFDDRDAPRVRVRVTSYADSAGAPRTWLDLLDSEGERIVRLFALGEEESAGRAAVVTLSAPGALVLLEDADFGGWLDLTNGISRPEIRLQHDQSCTLINGGLLRVSSVLGLTFVGHHECRLPISR